MAEFAASDAFKKPYPPIGYTSSVMPLLTQLHGRLSEYEDAIEHAYAIREKYGDTHGHIEPPSAAMMARLDRTSQAFDTVLQHVDIVDLHLDNNFVVLHRDACGATNALFNAPASEEEEDDKLRTVRTRSPILSNASKLDFSFRPYPSSEVLVHSPILAHSADLRLLASGPTAASSSRRR